MNRARLLEHISEQSGHSPEQITPEKHLVDDLGLDSLDLLEVTMSVEDELGLQFPDGELDHIKTVQDAIDYVGKQLGVTL